MSAFGRVHRQPEAAKAVQRKHDWLKDTTDVELQNQRVFYRRAVAAGAGYAGPLEWQRREVEGH